MILQAALSICFLVLFYFLSSLRGASSSCVRLRTSWRSSLSSASLMPKTGRLLTTSPGQSESSEHKTVKLVRVTGISQMSSNSSAAFRANSYLLVQKLRKPKMEMTLCFVKVTILSLTIKHWHSDKWLQGRMVDLSPYTWFAITKSPFFVCCLKLSVLRNIT